MPSASRFRSASPPAPPGELVRRERKIRGLTLAQLGQLAGYSAAQVSRYERGVSALTDVDVLRRFAGALDIPPESLGLAPTPHAYDRHEPSSPYPRLPAPTLGAARGEDHGVRRRRFLAAAAAAAGTPRAAGPGTATGDRLGDVLVARLRDTMLGLGDVPGEPAPAGLAAELHRVHIEFRACAWDSLAVRLPRLMRTAHAAAGAAGYDVLARSYLLATRLLIKLDEPQLGWMAADRARQLSEAAGEPLAIAESARQLAVLARKAGWHDQALTLALTAADDPALCQTGPDGAATRGLLIQSAAYTVAWQGDRDGMRELTAEAAAIARNLDRTHLRDHGGFSLATVQLHLVSAENSTGDPSAALAAADAIAPAMLPNAERSARYFTDVANAYARWGRREDCIHHLLQAERCAPLETHARPAVKSLITGLLLSGRTTPELRGLAARTGVLDG